MIKKNLLLRKGMLSLLFMALIFTMVPMMPGSVQEVSGKESLSSEISLVEATSNIGELLGYNNPYEMPSFTVETGMPAYFDAETAKWQKWDQRSGGGFKDYNGSYFTEGIYRYTCEVRIPDAAVAEGIKWALPFTIKVDGKDWTADTTDSAAAVRVYSIGYTIENPEEELVFNHFDSYDINEAYVDAPISSFSVVKSVSGGSEPYTFSKVSGPDWITVSADGNVSGTPTAKGENANLVVRVRDSANAYRDIEIYVENTTQDDGRTIISKIEATSNVDELLVYGKAYTRGDTQFSMISGTPAYLHSNESNGDWQRLVDGEWNDYEDTTFIEGTYRFRCQVRVDGDAGSTHKLSEKLSVIVDETAWEVDANTLLIFKDMSWVQVNSPAYNIKKPEQAPLVFSYNASLDIKTPYVGKEITSYTLEDQVSGGTAPYIFSKVSGPAWINVSTNGIVSGTPTATGEAQALVVRVTDGGSNYQEITIGVGETIIHNDDKTVVSTIEATSNFDELLVYGKSYTQGDTEFSMISGSPAYFNANASNGDWQKLVDDTWVTFEESVFVEGTYRFYCQVRVDDTDGKTHIVKGDALSVTVDDKAWTVESGLTGDTFSFVWVTSPEYVIEKPIVIPLMFVDSEEFDIGESFVEIPVTSFSVASAVTGGTEPYTFSKVSGPDWLTVSAEGTISGTPTEVSNGSTAVIRVTDAAESYKEITINLGKTYQNPASRTAVTAIVASSDIDVALGGAVTLPTITVTEGTQARFVISETNGKWYVKNGETWELYSKSSFEAGTYRFECPIKIDGEAGKSYVLADSVSITVDGKTWTAKAAPVVTNTSSTMDVYSAEYVIADRKDIAGATVTLDASSCSYDGIAKKPGVIVKDGENLLVKNTDYTVTYSNNVYIGTAKVTITGIGDYDGTVTKTFKIIAPKGNTYTVSGVKYKITNANTDGTGTVSVTGSSSKTITSLTVNATVTIGKCKYKVTSIAEKAFKGYTKLKTVSIGTNVTTIDGSAFNGCSVLTTVKGCTKVTKIGNYAFYNCKKLTRVGDYTGKVTLPAVKTIGSNAFRNCIAVTYVNLSSKQLTSIGESAFRGCTKLKTVSGCSAVTTINTSAFNGCTTLTTVKGCTKVTKVGNYAFYNCKRLTRVGNYTGKVTLPAVKTIGSNAFRNCTAVTYVNLSSKQLTSIGESAFRGCTKLKTVKITSTKLASIGKNCFDNCKILSNVTIKSTKLTKSKVGGSAFKGIKSNCTFKVPKSKVSSYKSIFKNKGAGSKIVVKKY